MNRTWRKSELEDISECSQVLICTKMQHQERWKTRMRGYEAWRIQWEDLIHIYQLQELGRDIIRIEWLRILQNWWKTPITRFRKTKNYKITESHTPQWKSTAPKSRYQSYQWEKADYPKAVRVTSNFSTVKESKKAVKYHLQNTERKRNYCLPEWSWNKNCSG